MSAEPGSTAVELDVILTAEVPMPAGYVFRGKATA